jgi:hypothetical protein
MSEELVERMARVLCGHIGCVESMKHGVPSPPCTRECAGNREHVMAEYGDAATAALSSIQLEDVVEALKPFAAAADTMFDVGRGAFPVDSTASIYTGFDEEDRFVDVQVGDFRRARDIFHTLTGAPSNG